MELTSDSLCNWLVEADLVEADELDQIANTTQSALTLSAALLERDLVTEVDLVNVISRHIDVPAAPRRLYKISVSHKVLQTIPEDLCWQHHLFPFGIDRSAGRLQVAMTDPTDDEAVQALHKIVGHAPQIFVVGPRSLDKAIRKHYLDSWIDETDGKRRRFFGYDNITDPRARAHRSSTDEPLPTADPPQRGPAVRHVDTPPPEPVEEVAREAQRAAATAKAEPVENEGTGTDELHAVKRVPTRGFAFDNVRNTAADGALDAVATEVAAQGDDNDDDDPSESADLPPAPKADPTSGDELAAATSVTAGEVELDEAARAKKDLDENITGPLPSRAELDAMAQGPPAANPRVALARILPDDRSTLLPQRVRTLERAVAGLMKLLTKSSDEHIAREAELLLEKLRDELS